LSYVSGIFISKKEEKNKEMLGFHSLERPRFRWRPKPSSTSTNTTTTTSTAPTCSAGVCPVSIPLRDRKKSTASKIQAAAPPPPPTVMISLPPLQPLSLQQVMRKSKRATLWEGLVEEVNNKIMELENIKHRLLRTLNSAEQELDSIRHRINEDPHHPSPLDDLQTRVQALEEDMLMMNSSKSNAWSEWFYGTVLVEQLDVYEQPTFQSLNKGVHKQNDTILLLNEFKENEEGFWMAIRSAHSPDRMYWICVCKPDDENGFSVGQFRLSST
jgi:hypothetical protein